MIVNKGASKKFLDELFEIIKEEVGDEKIYNIKNKILEKFSLLVWDGVWEEESKLDWTANQKYEDRIGEIFDSIKNKFWRELCEEVLNKKIKDNMIDILKIRK